MKIYFTNEDKKIIKKNYKYIKNKLAIIDIPILSQSIGLDGYNGDICADYILTKEIEGRLLGFYNSKRYNKILYIIDNIRPGFVSNFRKYIEDMKIYFTEYILIDYSQSIDPRIYKDFDSVI